MARRFLFAVLAVLGALATSRTADAQVDGRRIAGERSGFAFGFSFGRGGLDVECPRCGNVAAITEGLSLTAHAGFLLSPNLALLAEHWTVRWNDRGSEWFDDGADHLVAQRMTFAAAQLWLTPTLWLKAGLGVGWHISDSLYTKPPLPSDRSPRPASLSGETGSHDEAGRAAPAYFTAIGWEYAHTATFAADIQLRFGATRRPADEYQIYTTGLNFGLSWF